MRRTHRFARYLSDTVQHWPRRFFSATVDQFLGFMEHYYTGICLLPALADSAIIFDEVHSYDGPMFQTLLAFLDHFDVPVLCMTATLPPDHRDELEKRGAGKRGWLRHNNASAFLTVTDREVMDDGGRVARRAW